MAHTYMGKINILTVSLLLCFVLVCINSYAACTGSSPTWTCTASSTSAQINSCISSAGAGDTINIEAGSAFWNTTVVITNGIHIKGAGAGSTTVTCSSSNTLIQFGPVNESLNAEMEVSGFTFNTANRCMAIELGSGMNYNPTTFQTKVNINNNTFTGTTSYNSNYQYIFNYNMGGVVWKNTFNGADQQLRSLGDGTYDIFNLVPNTWNSAGALYIEDNKFTMSAPDSYYIADCQWSGVRRIWRYNTFTVDHAVSGSGFIDVHGFNADDAASCYGDIIYGNKVISSNNKDVGWLTARGGNNLLFYNDVTTTGSVNAGHHFGGTAGVCMNQHVSEQAIRFYAWNNRKNTTTNIEDSFLNCGANECGYACDTATSYPQADRQFFNYKTSYNGMSGVGCGPSLPANPSGYLNRTAYWVTSQSCSSVSGLVGDIASNPSRNTIAGALYEVQAGAWVHIYTPEIYPHPLRIHLSLPENLRILY
jgi:hypothetical protein